jgi:hypothetical protein
LTARASADLTRCGTFSRTEVSHQQASGGGDFGVHPDEGAVAFVTRPEWANTNRTDDENDHIHRGEN